MAEVYTSGGSSVLYGFEAANAFAGNSPTTDKTFGLNTRVSTLSLTTNRIDFNKLGQVEPHAFGYGQQQGSLSVGFVFDTRTSHAIFGGIYGESSAAGNSGAPHYYPNSAIGENKAPVITKSIATQVQVQMGSNLSTRKLLGGIVNSIGLSTSIGEAVNGTVDITFGKEVTATSPAIASGTVTAQASVTGVPLTFAHGTLSVSNGSSLVAIAEVQGFNITFNQNGELLYGLGSQHAQEKFRRVLEVTGSFTTTFKDNLLLQHLLDQAEDYTGSGGVGSGDGKGGIDEDGSNVAASLVLTSADDSGKSITIDLQGLSFDSHSVTGLEPVEPVMQDLPFKARVARVKAIVA